MSEVAKVIAAADVAGCEPWALPSMGTEEPVQSQRAIPLTASALESLQKRAYEEAFAEGRDAGYDAGFQHGLAQAQAEHGPLAQQCRATLDLLADPLSAMDEAVEETIVAMVFAIARQLIRRELRTEPGEVVGAVREGLKVLPAGAHHVRIHLHPADIPLVRGALGIDDDQPHAWEFVDDPGLSRGGCRVETEMSRVDATVEGRLAAVMASVLGGQREEDVDD